MTDPNMPCGATAALDQEQRRMEAADVQYAQREAAYPVKDFLPAAWEHLQDEGYEYLQDLLENHGEKVCRVLMRACDLGFEVNEFRDPEKQLLFDQSTIKRHMQGWALQEAERLQAEAIEAHS